MAEQQEPAGRLRPGLAVAGLTLGHAINDLYMGFLPGLLPLLVTRLKLSYAAAGLLVTVVTTSSHVIQPLLGYSADRIGRRVLVIVGPLISALAMCLLGVIDSYEALLTVLLIGSLGNALFHPTGASLTGSVSRRSPTSMAIFSAGGSVGYGLGPVVIVAAVAWVGPANSWSTVVLGLVTAGLMLAWVPRAVDAKENQPAVIGGERRLSWVLPLCLVFVVVTLRAAESTVFTTFAPLLFQKRGAALMLGSYAILGFSLAGAAGGLIAGPLCRRFSRKSITSLSLALAGVSLYYFLRVTGLPQLVSLLLFGAGLFAALPSNIVMAQELLPRHASTASGLVMGFAWGIGSLATTAVGSLADRLTPALGAALGLQRALEMSALLLLLAAAAALLLVERPGEAPPGASEAAETTGLA
jgi:FSR family fosmidomycin resistance protein-like MFS transporter